MTQTLDKPARIHDNTEVNEPEGTKHFDPPAVRQAKRQFDLFMEIRAAKLKEVAAIENFLGIKERCCQKCGTPIRSGQVR